MQAYTIDRPTDQTGHAPAFVPSIEDWESVRQWDAERADRLPDQCDDEVPAEVLDGVRPWWETAPWDPELDATYWNLSEPERFALPVGARRTSMRLDEAEDSEAFRA